MKLLLLSLLITSCATNVKRMTPEQRTTTKIVEHSLSKNESFKRVKSYLNLSLVDSNKTIKDADLDSGIIISKFNSDCDAGGLTAAKIAYSLKVDFKNKKTRINLVSDGQIINVGYGSNTHALGYSETFYKGIKGCRDSLVLEIETSLNKAQKNDNW